MRIGELSRRAGVSIDTIRYYEREDLIEPSSVRASGYREFDEAASDRLHFIGQAKELGFSLREIRDLLALKDNPDTTCNQVKARAEKKLADIDEKIATLQSMKRELEAITSLCKADDSGVESCAIVEKLKSRKEGDK